MPILAGLTAALCWGVSDYIITKPTRAIGQHRTTPYVLLFSALTLLPVLLWQGINSGIGALIWFLAVLSPIGAFLGYFFAYRAFRHGNLSIVSPIVGSYPMVTILGAVFILGDTLSGIEIASIVTIMVGIVLLSMKLSSLRSKRKLVAAGVGSALVSMLFLGLPAIFYGAYAAIAGFALLAFISRGGGSALAFSYGYLTRQDMGVPWKKYFAPIVFAGITDAFGFIAFLYALQINGPTLPIVSALSGFAGGVTVILGLFLLKEKPEANQFLGIFLAIIGVVVLSYFA